MTIKQDYDKILEGCGKEQIPNSIFARRKMEKLNINNKCDKANLCPFCSAKKEVFIQRCKDELKWIEDDLMLDLKVLRHKLNEKTIAQIGTEERITQLKEVLEVEK